MSTYLDHNATTPVDPRVRDAVANALTFTGNPSSIHAHGRTVRDLVESARRSVAGALDCAAHEIVFTSGGTESNCLGLLGLAEVARRRGLARRLLVSAVEHPSIWGPAQALAARDFEIVTVPVDRCGRVDPDRVDALAGDGAAICAVGLANHEIGTIQEIAAIAVRCRRRGILVHCDAVQAVGRVPVDAGALGVDSASLSAHKMFGPKGVGALFVRTDIDVAPICAGGGQESGRRPGTEAVPAIAGLGVAAELVPEHLAMASALQELRDRLESGLQELTGAGIVASGVARLPNTTCVRFSGVPAQALVQALDLAGFSVSAGAACSSGTVGPSPVLRALGYGDAASGEGVRVSTGPGCQRGDIEALLQVLPEVLARLRQHL